MKKFLSFHRGLKSRHVSFIALGGIIGSSFFLGTGYVLNQVGPFAFIAYALGGLITFLTMACLAELSVAVPIHGSFVRYASKFISPSWGCGVGWSYWINWVVYIPSECIAAGILMHSFVPELPVYLWSVIFGILITVINLSDVKAFGEMEFWLSLTKMIILFGFSLLAILIFFGLIGSQKPEIIGTKYLITHKGIFPNGFAVLFINMVVLIANFQGSEIIGLSAAESEDPKKNIPRALKKVTYRLILLYFIPIFLLGLIFPWEKANLSGSVFAVALHSYGLIHIAHVFSFLIIAGAISCANSGLYAATRSLHTLSLMGMAPPFLKKVDKNGVPIVTSLITLGVVWMMLIISFFLSAHKLYANLLALSGFTGSISWISICWSQLRYRKKLKAKMQNDMSLEFKIKGFPYITLFAIWIQIICLLIVLFNPDLRSSFYFGVPALVVPILIYKYLTLKNKKIIT
ncbi:MAG: amino acid permease [Parachlamydiales bacterium]